MRERIAAHIAEQTGLVTTEVNVVGPAGRVIPLTPRVESETRPGGVA